MSSATPIYLLPDIRSYRPKHLTLSPAKQDLNKTLTTKNPKPSALSFPTVYKNIASKINTNLKKEAKNRFPEVKFEPMTWSNNTTIQEGFFNLPKISDILPLYDRKFRSSSNDPGSCKKTCEMIEEVPDYPSRPMRKFTKIESPWKFQGATHLSPT